MNWHRTKAYRDSGFSLHLAAGGKLKLRDVTGLKHILTVKQNCVKGYNKCLIIDIKTRIETELLSPDLGDLLMAC